MTQEGYPGSMRFRLTQEVRYVPPGYTAELSDGRTLTGPVLLNGPMHWSQALRDQSCVFTPEEARRALGLSGETS